MTNNEKQDGEKDIIDRFLFALGYTEEVLKPETTIREYYNPEEDDYFLIRNDQDFTFENVVRRMFKIATGNAKESGRTELQQQLKKLLNQ